uniref:Uncharacterized protein n=1 Tax=Anopheles coluzzii TaxID=1518534 RepID=A0A8W7PBU4_ANOCL
MVLTLGLPVVHMHYILWFIVSTEQQRKAAEQRRSLSSRRNILPLAVFGICSINRTPPYKRFCSDTLLATKSFTSCSVSCSPCSFTTNASGSSPARSSGTPITAASLTFGCSSSIASSSAGGTWKPLYLISSLIRSTMKNS